jgi:hypothetical protein
MPEGVCSGLKLTLDGEKDQLAENDPGKSCSLLPVKPGDDDG